MQTAPPAGRLTEAQRATEAAQILARGVIRWHRARIGNPEQEYDPESEFPLDLLPTKSVHADGYQQPELGA